MHTHTQKSKKKRLLIAAGIFALPIVVIVVMIVAVMGRHKKPVPAPNKGSAFNTSLPSPNLPKTDKNKLEIYMQAQQDSIKQRQERAKDPYMDLPHEAAALPLAEKTAPTSSSSDQSPHSGTLSFAPDDDNDKKVSEKIKKIYAALQSPAGTRNADQPERSTVISQGDQSATIARLQGMMATLQEKDTSTDPQLRQVKEVLDQIMAIKHSDQMQLPAAASSKPSSAILPVADMPPPKDTTRENTGEEQNGFFGLSDDEDSNANVPSQLEAVVHTDQTVQTGSTVKLRLLQPIYVAGEQIPANTFIYGVATIAGERVSIQLTNAIYNGRIFSPISLKVYDGTDGLEGLYVPGLITRDVVKQNMSQGVSGMNIASLDPSLGAQAAVAGIETARSLLNKKISLVKATLKAGHVAILKDTNKAH